MSEKYFELHFDLKFLQNFTEKFPLDLECLLSLYKYNLDAVQKIMMRLQKNDKNL